MGGDMIRDVPRGSINPGLVARVPDIEIHQGDSRQFGRTDPVAEGHQRRSPGDTGVAKPAPKAAQPGKADPMDDSVNPTTRGPIRAEGFARGMGVPPPGTVPGLVSGQRGAVGPVDPATALFGANGHRPDFGQLKEIDPSNVLPNKDDAIPRPVGSPHAAKPAVTKTEPPDATRPWGTGTWDKT